MDWNPAGVLVVSAKLETRQEVAGMLFRLGIEALCVASADQCRRLPAHEIALVFCDLTVKDGDYRDVLWALAPDAPACGPKVILMTDFETHLEYEEARQRGVFEMISKPCRQTDIEWMVILTKRYWQNRARLDRMAEPSLSVMCKAAGAGA